MLMRACVRHRLGRQENPAAALFGGGRFTFATLRKLLSRLKKLLNGRTAQ